MSHLPTPRATPLVTPARTRPGAPTARRTHVTVAEAARSLHLSPSGVISRINAGKIQCVRVRSRILIPRAELARQLWETVPALRHSGPPLR